MDETIHVILNVLFDFALEGWFSICGRHTYCQGTMVYHAQYSVLSLASCLNYYPWMNFKGGEASALNNS